MCNKAQVPACISHLKLVRDQHYHQHPLSTTRLRPNFIALKHQESGGKLSVALQEHTP